MKHLKQTMGIFQKFQGQFHEDYFWDNDCDIAQIRCDKDLVPLRWE